MDQSNNHQAQKGEDFEITKFPQEIQDLIQYESWRASWSPRNIVCRYCCKLTDVADLTEPTIIQHIQVQDTYTHPPALVATHLSRKGALKGYERVLAHLKPDLWVYFNFDLDTLVINPFDLVERYDLLGNQKRARCGIARNSDQIECIAILDECLEEGNNLGRLQSLTIGRYHVCLPKIWRSWEVFNSTPQSFPKFQDCIAKGLHNLRELILVLEDTTFGGVFPLKEIDPELLEEGRREVVSMFEEVKLENPACKIPEIFIVKHNDPRAPTEFLVSQEEVEAYRKKWGDTGPFLTPQ
jgi:hypothetical protein